MEHRLGIKGRAGIPFPALLSLSSCPMQVYVDDVRMDDFDLDKIEPRFVDALEVYHGNLAEMPPGYGNCGVIFVWLKHG